jgi:hypothetical protein
MRIDFSGIIFLFQQVAVSMKACMRWFPSTDGTFRYTNACFVGLI